MAKRTIENVYDIAVEIQKSLAARAHYDTAVESHEIILKGDGKGSIGLQATMALTEDREKKRDRREWLIFTLLASQIVALIVAFISKF